MTASPTVQVPNSAKNPPAAGHITPPGHSQTANTQIPNKANQNSSTSSQDQGATVAQNISPGHNLAQPVNSDTQTANTSTEVQQPVNTEPALTQTTSTAPANTEASDENNLVLKAITTISEHKKPIVKWANYFQAAANALSFVSKFPFLSKIKNFGDKLGEAGTKLFFLVNGGINAFQQFQYKNYTGFLGYLVYVANGLFVPQEKTYMLNGLGVGLTQWVNQANTALKVMDNNHKGTFTGLGDHLTKLFRGTANIIKESWRNPIQAMKEGKPILGLGGAFMALYGVAHWAVTGNIKVGKFFRNLLGGAALDGEQILGHQLKYKRENYAKSGIAYLVGTAFDYIRDYVPSLNEFFRPLSFLFDGFGRYYQGVSEQNNEQSNAHLSKQESEEIEARHKSPSRPSYLSMLGDLFKGWFSTAKPKAEDATIIANAGHQGELASAAA